jgi:peptidylprolyl isomerase
MTTVTNGSTVTFHYKGTLEDGTEFDSSYGRDQPMTATTGESGLIAGFETALTGMTEGETKTFTLEPAEAYGDHNPEAFTQLEKSVFPDDFPFESGMTVPLMGPNGQVMATLTEISDTTVTADLNHPLAGKTLTFEIEVLTIK